MQHALESVSAEDVFRLFRTGQTDDVRPALARLVLSAEPEIRQIARERLFAATRSLFDTDELMGTVLRRLDRFVCRGMFAPTNADDIWALIRTVAHHSAVTKIRLTQRARALTKEDGPYVQGLLERLNKCPDDDEVANLLTRLMMAIPGATDRQIFGLRLRGTTHKVTAQLVGISEVAARKRWSETMTFLKEHTSAWEER